MLSHLCALHRTWELVGMKYISLDLFKFQIRISIKVINWIQNWICINLQMTSHNVWTMSLLVHFFKVFIWKIGSGSGSASLIRIRIKMTNKIRIRIHFEVTNRIRIRIGSASRWCESTTLSSTMSEDLSNLVDKTRHKGFEYYPRSLQHCTMLR